MKAKRIASVDILRGFTIVAMILVNTPGTWSHVYAPLLHADWHGYTPTDLVFPFFLFIVGISISFAYKNKLNTAETYKKISIRSLKIVGLGLFYCSGHRVLNGLHEDPNDRGDGVVGWFLF